jgi:hypothetical protein
VVVEQEEQPPVEAPPPPAPTLRWPLVAAIAALALLPTIVLSVLYIRLLQSTTQMLEANARMSSVVQEQQAQLATLQQNLKAISVDSSSEGQAVAGALVEFEAVPYGEAPLSGARLYWEYFGKGYFNAKGVSIPVAVSVFPDELYPAPKSWTEQAYPNLIHYNRVARGGHFAAWEQPALSRRRSVPDCERCARSGAARICSG